jgi:twitching motility protein PilU
VVEILINTPLVSDFIRKGEVHKLKDIMAKSNEQGMITFDQALFQLLQEGEISYEEAIRHADSANELRLMVKLKGSQDISQSLAESADKISLVSDEEDEEASVVIDGITQPAAPDHGTKAPEQPTSRAQQPPRKQKLRL